MIGRAQRDGRRPPGPRRPTLLPGVILCAAAVVAPASAAAVESRYQIYLGYGSQTFEPGETSSGDLQSVQITYRAVAPAGPRDALWSFEYGAEIFRSGARDPQIVPDGPEASTRGRFFFYRVARLFGAGANWYAGGRLGFYYVSGMPGGNISDMAAGVHFGRRIGRYDVSFEVLAAQFEPSSDLGEPVEARLTLGVGF